MDKVSGNLLGEQAPELIEAEKSHDKPSASWRPLDIGSLAQYKYRGLKAEEDAGINLSLSLKVTEPRGGRLLVSSGVQRPESLLLFKGKRIIIIIIFGR
jgi:hypothetical protein